MAQCISELSRKEREAIKKRHEAMGKPVITRKEFETMKRTESGITGTMITLRTQLTQLEREITADKKGMRDYDVSIERLRKRVEDLQQTRPQHQNQVGNVHRTARARQ